MDKEKIKTFKEVWEKSRILFNRDPSLPPHIMVGGCTGSGKSSLLNALLQKKVFEADFGRPVTRENSEEFWRAPDESIDIVVIDAPGFGEAEKITAENKDEYMQNTYKIAEMKVDLLILVLDANSRALSAEDTFLKHWFNNPRLSEIPVLVCVNKIDTVPPVRESWPELKNNFNIYAPVSEKEKNLRKLMHYIRTLSSFERIPDSCFLLVCAGESFDDIDYQFGIDDLREKIYATLPESVRTVYARALAVATLNKKLLKTEAKSIIKKYSALCSAAVAANFVPASDALVLAPLQIAMIKKLGDLYGKSLTQSAVQGILSAVGMSFAGRTLCSFIISFFPGVKNLVGPPLAFGLTYSIGKLVSELFDRGIEAPDSEIINELAGKCSVERPDESEMDMALEKYKQDIDEFKRELDIGAE